MPINSIPRHWAGYIHCSWLYTIRTSNLRLWSHSGEILGPKRRHGASQLEVGGVTTVRVEGGGGVVDNLFRLHLVSDVPLVVGTSFEKTCPGKFLGAPCDHGEVDGSAVH